MMNYRQILEKIKLLEAEISIYKKVLDTASESNKGRPTGTTYSNEQIEFLKYCEDNKLTDK